ncbi:MAG: tRNA lysidine(34) synthetase TilS [Candidatus Omnitrophica bacterium]|jgi:tRNA(Ile)-lysidine synthase|nr:tRNA lysidine(34) synthetase TilS [Candidatus Omnitrophota bacterium]
MIEKTFRNTIERYGLLERKDRLMLGISGGPDSIFMLYQFYNLAKEYKLQLVCAHFNHMLRPEADREEEFVKNICKDLGIKFISEKKDVNKFFKGDSLEQTARNLRFDFFLNSSRHFKVKKLSLAHHKDDLVETVLMRIIRGSGLKGLRAFLPKSKFKNLTIIRPLIELHKKDILKWLEDKKISYCVDKSNFEDRFLRNRIRLKLMPMLCEINPGIAQNLYNLSLNTSLDYDFIYTFSHKEFEKLKRGETKRGIKLDLEGLKKNHPAILNNIIRVAIEELKGNTRRLELKHLDEIRDMIENRPLGSVVHLPGLYVRKEEKHLVIQTLIL